MNPVLPLWVEISVALLLALSGVFALAAAIGLLRFKTFFMRMHPPALAFTFSSWCVALASVIYFSAQDQKLAPHAWLIVIFLAMTVPVTTTLLARTALFRKRTGERRAAVPAPLSATSPPPPGVPARPR